MTYLIEPRDRIYVNGNGFLSFAKNIGTHASKVAKNFRNKYSQKPLHIFIAEKSTTDGIKAAAKESNSKNYRNSRWFNWEWNSW